MKIEIFNNDLHREQVIDLWIRVFNYPEARNKPFLAIDKKIAENDNLFFVGITDGVVIASVMAGYDGHRGWIYSLAVLPEKRNNGIGSQMLRHAEASLKRLGCVKINLQLLVSNEPTKNSI